MAFLSKEELKTVALPEVIDIITRSDDGIVTDIIAESTDLMKNYLVNFDIDKIFTQTGDDRSKTVLKYLKDIVIFEIYIRRTHEYNEVAKLRYDEAMNWLEKVGSGKINANLPIKPKEEGETGTGTIDGFFKLGSRKNYTNTL